MDAGRSKHGWKDKLDELLRNPLHARVLLTAMMLLLGYWGIYLPLDGASAELGQRLKGDERRLELARETEELRVQFARIKPRLPAKSDTNEWVQYIFGGIRQFPVKLVTLDSEVPRGLGPYRAVVLRIELEGTFQELNNLLRWLETNQRLMRVDACKLEPNRQSESLLTMQLTVLGVTP